MLDRIIDRARAGEIVPMTADELAELRSRAELLAEEDTYISDMIRIFRLDDLVFIQETADKTQIIVRTAPSVEDARAFVARRLETYERMWDGCGCSVSYFEKSS